MRGILCFHPMLVLLAAWATTEGLPRELRGSLFLLAFLSMLQVL